MCLGLLLRPPVGNCLGDIFFDAASSVCSIVGVTISCPPCFSYIQAAQRADTVEPLDPGLTAVHAVRG